MQAQHQLSITKQIGIAAVAGAVFLALVGVAIPKTYTSSASLLFPGATGSGGNVNPEARTPPPPAATAGTSGSGSDQPSLPLLQGVLTVPQPGTSPTTAGLILKSRKTIARIVRQYDLDKEWGLSLETATNRFQQSFVCTSGTSGDLRIAYTDRSRQRAKRVLSTAVQLLTSSVEELSLDPAARNLQFLKESLAKAEEDYAAAQKVVVDFQKSLGGAPPDMQVEYLGQIHSGLEKDLIQAEVEESVARANSKAITDMGGKILRMSQDPAGSDKALVTIQYHDLVSKESDLALLREKFTDKRPEVVQARQAVDVSRRKLQEEVRRQTEAIKEGASPFVKDAVLAAVNASARAEGLRKSERATRQKLSTLPEAQAQFAQLEANLRDERNRLSLVRSEYAKAELIAQSRGPQFVVVDPPAISEVPNGYTVLDFAFAGLLLGPLLVVGRLAWLWLRHGMKMMASGQSES